MGDIQLGPVETSSLPSYLPQILLIDEIDKSDVDLPNDLINLFEEGIYEIAKLVNLSADVIQSKVTCYEFTLVIMTSNGERNFPPTFYQRCLRVRMPDQTSVSL